MCLAGGTAWAHCDTMDGPVVKAARQALEKGDVTPVLKWVRSEDEAEVRAAFAKTVKVRTLGGEAKELAERYFFETVVRLHRAGEGEPYTGLKPAGTGVEPAIQEADKALQTGRPEQLLSLVSEAVNREVRKRFAAVLEKQKRAEESVAAGREYVAAYVEFIHYVEGLQAEPGGERPGAHAKKAEPREN